MLIFSVQLVDWPEGGYLTTDSPMPRGEIVVGGPNVTLGYFKNDGKTKEVYKVVFLVHLQFHGLNLISYLHAKGN